jgi:HPt (histidine-containing phosphotransfer) domain-containing protein
VSAEPVLNADSLDRLRTVFIPDNERGLREVIRAYLEESAGLIEDLGSAISLRDVSLVRTSSHTLKSSSAELGADGFAGICQQLERDAISEDLDHADALYKELVSLYPDVVSALKSESRKLAS